jgi:hypothetical protein
MLVGAPETQLQRVGDVITLCEYTRCNLIIDLSWMSLAARNTFTERLLRALLESAHALRAATLVADRRDPAELCSVGQAVHRHG